MQKLYVSYLLVTHDCYNKYVVTMYNMVDIYDPNLSMRLMTILRQDRFWFTVCGDRSCHLCAVGRGIWRYERSSSHLSVRDIRVKSARSRSQKAVSWLLPLSPFVFWDVANLFLFCRSPFARSRCLCRNLSRSATRGCCSTYC